MGRTRRARAPVLVLLLAGALLAAGACASDDEEPQFSPSAPSASADSTTGGGDGTAPEQRAGDETYLVAEARNDTLGIWRSPAESDSAERTLDAAGEAGGRLVLLVKQQLGAAWVEVWLPSEPAGESGWVRRDDVSISRHRFRIEVSRSAHTLTVFAGGVNVLQTPVAIGSDAPAESDGLYIKDLVETPNPGGRYGRYAYGLSGSSNQADRFAAGRGVVGIHGTNDPGSLGADVDGGSLAISDEALERLVHSIGLPLGTPVAIVP